MRKTILSLALALALCLGLTLPAAASDTARAGAYVTISAGISHTGVIDQNGSLWMWGSNKFYQLGSLSYDTEYWNQSVPMKILDDVAAVSCGDTHTAAIKTDGSLWMWGDDGYGQIGIGGNANIQNDIFKIQYEPVKVMDDVAAVSCGEGFTAAIKTDGSLWTWGNNMSGQLGNGGDGNAQTKSGFTYQTVPLKVMDDVIAVSCGRDHTAAIKTDGTLWTWGSGSNFKLGNGLASNIYDAGVHGENQLVPAKVMDGVAVVNCGSEFTAAVKTDGSLWAWGYNAFGEVGSNSSGSTDDGFGNITQNIQPTPVKILDGVASVSCGYDFAAAVKADGSLWMWGSNYAGQFGNGGGGNAHYYDIVYQTSPVKVVGDVAAVSCGYDFTTVIKTDGSLWTCGTNNLGQLGNGGKGNFKISRYDGPCQNTMGKVMDNIKLPKSSVPSTPAGQTSPLIAYASTQTVQVDGKPVEFQMYALKDQTGNPTNYVKVRDVAYSLNGTAAQFNVTWDGTVNLVPKSAYVSNGSEMSTPYTGDRAYKAVTSSTKVNGIATNLDAFMLTDDNGGGYTYYKLRDLGMALGFNVGWSAERGVYIETDKPYQD